MIAAVVVCTIVPGLGTFVGLLALLVLGVFRLVVGARR